MRANRHSALVIGPPNSMFTRLACECQNARSQKHCYLCLSAVRSTYLETLSQPISYCAATRIRYRCVTPAFLIAGNHRERSHALVVPRHNRDAYAESMQTLNDSRTQSVFNCYRPRLTQWQHAWRSYRCVRIKVEIQRVS